MSILHLLVLALGVVAAVVAADLLRHRDIGSWPVGILVVVLIPITGWTYSAWLASLTLGLGIGFAGMAGIDLVRSVGRGRSLRTQARRSREWERERQMELGAQARQGRHADQGAHADQSTRSVHTRRNPW